MAATNSEAQSLRESLGVRAAYISWIVRGFRHPFFVPRYKKVPFFYKITDMRRSSKKTPSSAKNVTRVRPPPPLYLSAPPPPPPPPPPGIRSTVMISISTQCMIEYFSNDLKEACQFSNHIKSKKMIRYE